MSKPLSVRKPEQGTLGDMSRFSWGPRAVPDPVTAPSATRAPAVPKRPARSARAVPRDSQDVEQFNLTQELKRRVVARCAAGEDPEAAFQAVKRELWPDEYRSERGE